MVIKIKVSDLAKDFGKQNKAIIELLSKYCDGPAKKANTVLTEEELNTFFDTYTQENSVKSFDEYFATKKPAEKPNAPRRALFLFPGGRVRALPFPPRGSFGSPRPAPRWTLRSR